MSRRDNFYRRDPGLALSGMAGMSLEERGVYNTIIDLLYLTWRPLEDKASYIAGHCGCAVQKLNPIINRLVAAGKLIRFDESGRSYISDSVFERERSAVKGTSKTRSGRAGVEEKSAGVGKNPTTCDDEVSENQTVTDLEKRREDKKSDANASSPISATPKRADDVQTAFDDWNALAGRLSLPKAEKLTPTRRAKIKARLRDGGLDRWRAALVAVERSPLCLGENDRNWRADLDFVCTESRWHRLHEGYYLGKSARSASPAPKAETWGLGEWATAVRRWREHRAWEENMGPPPGQPGCRVPPEVLITDVQKASA